MSTRELDPQKIIDLLLDGLSTDGAHHKQWYLYQVLVEELGQDEAESLLAAEGMDDDEYRGIPG